MIIRNILILCLASTASAFLVAPPLIRSSLSHASNCLQVSLSESGSETENSDVAATANENELSDASGNVGESPDVSAEPEEKLPSAETERHTIYVGNLPYSVEVKDVREIFSEHVDVRYVNLPRDRESGRIKGFAFVDVSTPEEIPKAIEILNGALVEGRPLRVSRYLAKDQIRSSKQVDGTKKLYVGNLPYGATKEDVNEFFSNYSDILDVFIPVNSYGDSRGFAFISVKEEDVETILEKTKGANFMGRNLVVNLPLPPGEKPVRKAPQENVKLFVGNLSFYTQSETLEEVFEEFGQVLDCYIPTDINSGSSRGFGFVTMEKEPANAAIEGLDGFELEGRIISVNEARPRAPKEKPSNSSDDLEAAE